MPFIPEHVFLPAGHPLPLRWFRLPLLLATLGLSCVCIAVGAQALDKSSKLERFIKAEGEGIGSTITFDMNDIRSTTIVLTTVASLLALTSFIFATSLAIDWIKHLLKPSSAATAKERSFISFDESHKHPTSSQRPAFSTCTLRFQVVALSFLSVWLLPVLILSTVFVRKRSAHLTIVASMPNLSVAIDTMYWDYGFLRCLAAAPWFTFIFSFPASIVTLLAWKYSPTPNTLQKA